MPTPSTKEPQEGETEAAYQAFKEYLDSDRRRVGEHGPSARNWSMRFHWAHRARELDVYMSRIDLEEQVRSRRRRNERHRRMAAVAESKIVEWLSTLTPEKIERMSAADATRLWDVAVRIERAATSAVDLDDLPNPTVSRPTRTRLDDEPDDDEDEDDGDWTWLMRHPFEARLAVVRRAWRGSMRGSASSAPETISTSSTATGSFPGATTAGIPTAGCTGTSFRWSDPDRAYSDEFLRHVAEVYEAGRAEGNGRQAVIDMFGLGAVEAWLERARSRGFLTPRFR